MDQQELQKRMRKAAHDVRTPITSITGFADLIAEDRSVSAGTREMAATIAAETRRLSEMLESFFDEISVPLEAE